MSTAASRCGYGRRTIWGYLGARDERGGLYFHMPTAFDMTCWARTHGYPNWPNTHPVYADLSDADRMAVGSFHRFHDHLQRARVARESGLRDAAAYHRIAAADCRRSYAYNRRGNPQRNNLPVAGIKVYRW